ncbi:diaboline synthase-like [Bidens hawaiensis]|uniref:diaboline synthase-like n=1 Tax=Bidens hawaiensis TaxID=980011 RepID=UPI00404ABB43
MKKSLSHSLTQYYPFAGRLHSPISPYTQCNDEGVVFVEAKHVSQMNMSQHVSEDDDIVCQLFVDGLSWWQHSPNKRTDLLGVQVNHFACGGIAVAVAMSHLIGDGCTFGSLMSHWASVARYGSLDHKDVLPYKPHFIQVQPTTDFHGPPPQASVFYTGCVNHVTRKFVFPNSKLSDLKNKVLETAEGGSTLSINKPTRVEPQTAVGNLGTCVFVTTKHESEASLNVLVSRIQKQKMEIEGVKSMQLASERIDSAMSRLSKEEGLEDYKCFLCSSLCGFPFDKVDFGWGNPAVASITFRPTKRIGSLLMDTPSEDGIEAWVTLEKEDMERFQNDKELISFCQN